MDRIVVIVGPTASGKTALSVALAKKLRGEVISADSMQIYRGMDVGTAKVTPEEMDGIPHHMIDVADPAESFSAARFVEMADPILRDILSRGKTAVIAGGTGLYVDALIQGRAFAPCPATGKREALEAEADLMGMEHMLDRLRQVDPDSAARLHLSDRKRILRALEVYEETGRTITAHNLETQKVPPRYDPVWLGLSFADRAALYRRIDRRVDEMLARGLEQEVRGLLSAGLSPRCTAMQAIGYKEVAAAIGGACTMAEAAEAVKRGSRRYAKRQLSWLRRDGGLHWLLWDEAPDIEAGVKCALEWISTENDTPPAV